MSSRLTADDRETFLHIPLMDITAGQRAFARENKITVHSGTNRVCTPSAACSTRSTGLSTGACGQRAWWWRRHGLKVWLPGQRVARDRGPESPARHPDGGRSAALERVSVRAPTLSSTGASRHRERASR